MTKATPPPFVHDQEHQSALNRFTWSSRPSITAVLVAAPVLIRMALASLSISSAYLSIDTAHAQSILSTSNAVEAPNGAGIARTITTNPSFDTSNPFFAPLGTNGRSCATCHGLTEALTFTAAHAQKLFDDTAGMHPIFAAVDGANSPSADMSTVDARRNNTSLLRTKGLIRVEFAPPKNAEFVIESVDDPYNYANTSRVSAYRRPLASTNLRFASTVMWDGRELDKTGNTQRALRSQVIDAVLGHMQAPQAPSRATVKSIVDFETHLFTTQVVDNEAGALDEAPIFAGPESLLRQAPLIRSLRALRRGPPPQRGPTREREARPNPLGVFNYFRPWLEIPGETRSPEQRRQESIARGEQLFNTRPFLISNAPGFTDTRNEGKERLRRVALTGARLGTCSSCHNLSSIGSSAKPLLINTGISDGSMRTPDMPLYTLRNKKTGARVQTTDPGAAMKSGKWRDIGKFKVPSLRALESHSPYMHNGFTGDLLELLAFYDRRFTIGLTEQEKLDLQAFLKAL